MTLTYSGKSKPTALGLAEVSPYIVPTRGSRGDINWGKRFANTTLNSDISSVTNKRKMRLLFAENGVPMPKLLSLDEAVRAVSAGKTIVGRPDRHSKGRGFWKIDSLQALRRAQRGTRRKSAATHYMEFVSAPREYRVHIFLGRSIRISEKKFGVKGETSRGDYITIKPSHNIKHVRRAAKQAVAAVGLDFGAVDILADDENCWVLEVNSAPSLGGSLPRLYAHMFRLWEEGELNKIIADRLKKES
jgi:glutathione synthase/RimK-type ligase-like ATP-grasp enzyme